MGISDPEAYQRFLPPLAEKKLLSDLRFDITKVPEVNCASTCAIEWWVTDANGVNKGKYESQTFTIGTADDPNADKPARKSLLFFISYDVFLIRTLVAILTLVFILSRLLSCRTFD